MTGLYIHIPFCIRKCGYCDFSSFEALDTIADAYIDSLLREMDYYVEKFNPDIRTLFIGGGTPTCLTEPQLGRLFNGIFKRFPRERFREITIEANPETLTPAKALLLSGFISRISIGAQTFDDKNLKILGRIHNSQKITEAVKISRDAGIKDLNLDLMFGIPGQKTGDVVVDVERAIEHCPEHISFYMLTAYEHTPFGARIKSGEIKLPTEEQASDMYMMGIGFLEAAGFEQYEISNFARENKICLHNMNYWDCGQYIGLGSSAASFFDNKRYVNVSGPREYMKLINDGKDPAGFSETYTKDLYMKDYIMLGLRKRKGLVLADFKDKFGFDFADRYSNIIDKYSKSGHMESGQGELRLTPAGFMVSNTVISEFF